MLKRGSVEVRVVVGVDGDSEFGGVWFILEEYAVFSLAFSFCILGFTAEGGGVSLLLFEQNNSSDLQIAKKKG